MSGISIEGFAYSGKLQDLSDTSHERLRKRFVTVLPIGSNRAAVDVIAQGYFRVGAADRVVEVGSDAKQLVITGHDIKKGDLIRIKTTANGIEELEVGVRSIVDANTVELDGVLSQDLAAGDTVDILRSVAQRFDSTGATLASVEAAPLKFIKDAAEVEVTEDTATPANNIPLPVKLMDVTGDVNITAGDLNVQLDHTGASYDSVRIGDGTNLMAVNADGSINIDLGADVDIRDLLHTQDSVKVGDGTDFLEVNADGSINATVSATDLDIRDLSASQDNVAISDGTDTLAINGDGSINATVSATDLDIRDLSASQDNVAISDGTNTLAVNGDGSLDVICTATDLDIRDLSQATDSVAIGDGTDTVAVSAAGALLVEATDLDVRDLTHASDSVKVGDGTEFLAINADGSINVNESSGGAVGTRQFIRNDYSSTNVTTGAFVELTASLTQDMTQAEIFDSGGQTMELATGAGGSEVVRFRIFPGGNGFVPLDASVFASGTRVSLRAVSATADAGEININFYGL